MYIFVKSKSVIKFYVQVQDYVKFKTTCISNPYISVSICEHMLLLNIYVNFYEVIYGNFMCNIRFDLC